MRHDDDAEVKTCCIDGHTQEDCKNVEYHINVPMPKGLQRDRM